MQPILSLNNVSKSFGKKKVLNNLSLDLFEGEILGLIGRSGCGKSTLIKILVGYYNANQGEIIFHGKNIKNNFKEVKQLVGYTTQDNSFYEKLTLIENMRYYANLYSLNNREKRINELLKSVELDSSKNSLAEKISGGMKRRLDYAISLLHNPKIVILDEPTTGLDPLLVENFWKIVQNVVRTQKIAVLVSSHILSEISEYCDKVAIMSKGEISKIIHLTRQVNVEEEFRRFA